MFRRRRSHSVRENARAVVARAVVETLEGRRLMHSGHEHFNLPHLGVPFGVGSTPVTIQAEDYDLGGEGIAYHDTSARNTGGQYRPDESVDIMSHGSGLYRIGGPYAGEWLKYTIDVAQAGEYELEFRVSQTHSGSTFHAEVDGVNVSGSLAAPATGSFDKFASVSKTVSLPAGQHVLSVAYNTAAANGYAAGLDWIKVAPASEEPPPPQPSAQQPYHGAPVPVGSTPVTIQAEDYDRGGEGIAYHDTSTNNTGKQYRPDESVDVMSHGAGQYRIGGPYAGEWLEYTIDVAQAGVYELDFRVSQTHAGSTFRAEVNGLNVTGALAAPATGSFNTFASVSKSVSLTAGQHVLRFAWDADASNGYGAGVDWIKVTPVNLDPAPSVPPAAPTDADALPLSPTQVRLRWVDNADYEYGYRIYRKTGDDGTWALIDAVAANETEFLDNGLAPDTRYVYRVAAFNAFGQSAFSNEDDATTHQSNPGGTTISWQQVTSSPINRAESNGAVVNGKLYVLGGLYVENRKILATPRSDVYDPATDTWTRIADCPDKVTHSGIVVVGDTIWLIGGYFGDHPGPAGNTVLKYNTMTNSWSRGPDLPFSRGAGGAALVNNQIHFFGGMNYNRTWESSNHWALDLSNPDAGWIDKAPLLNPRNHTSGAAVNGYVYCIGGQHGQEEDQVAQRDIDRYDPSTDRWEKVAELPTVRSHVNASMFVMEGKIVILGGETGYDQGLRNVTVFDPFTNTTTEMSPLPEKRSTSVAGVLPDGRIITATGNTPMPSATTYIGTIS